MKHVYIAIIALVLLAACEPITPQSERFGLVEVDYPGTWILSGDINYSDGSTNPWDARIGSGSSEFLMEADSRGADVVSFNLTITKGDPQDDRSATATVIYDNYHETKSFTSSDPSFAYPTNND